MGMWGFGILENDFALDIRDEFLFHYDHNVKIPIIRKVLLKKYRHEFRDNDSFLFWFPLAYCEWECGSLEDCVLKKVSDIVENMVVNGYEITPDGNAESAREPVFEYTKFINDLSRYNPNPRKRKTISKINPKFKSGDCVVIKFSNGLYGGIYIVGEDTTRGYNDLGRNSFLSLNLNQIDKPDLDDFKKSRVINLSAIIGFGKPKQIRHFLAKDLQNDFNPKQNYEVVGNLPCDSLFKSSGLILWEKYFFKLERYFENPLFENKKLETLSHKRSAAYNEPKPMALMKFFAILILILGIYYLIIYYLGF